MVAGVESDFLTETSNAALQTSDHEEKFQKRMHRSISMWRGDRFVQINEELPALRNVILFGNRIVADIIKVKLYWSRVRP